MKFWTDVNEPFKSFLHVIVNKWRISWQIFSQIYLLHTRWNGVRNDASSPSTRHQRLISKMAETEIYQGL